MDTLRIKGIGVLPKTSVKKFKRSIFNEKIKSSFVIIIFFKLFF